MFDVLPGRSKHIAKASPGMQPTPGFDSHRSANFVRSDGLLGGCALNSCRLIVVRWFLFNEDQCVPRYVLHIRAIEDRRTKQNDEVHDAEGTSLSG